MNNLLFKHYLKTCQYGKMKNLSVKQREVIRSSSDISIEDKVYIESKCVVEENERISELPREEQQKIFFRDIERIEELEGELKKLNLTIDPKKRESLELDIKRAKRRICYCKEGIKGLLEDDDLYLEEKMPLLMDSILSGYEETVEIMLLLYNFGYKRLVLDNIMKYRGRQVLLLGSDDLKNELISRELLQMIASDKDEIIFRNLSDENKPLLAYYKQDVFERDYSFVGKGKRLTVKKELEEIFKESFSGRLSDDSQALILGLYGKVAANYIELVIKKAMEKEEYLANFELVQKYFGDSLASCVKLWAKYPMIFEELLQEKVEVTDELKERLQTLSELQVLEGVQAISDGIEGKSYVTGGNEVKITNKIAKISPENERDAKLFKHYWEVIRIDREGEVLSLKASSSHIRTLRNLYNKKEEEGGNEILYEANMQGDILFLTENLGLQVWLPPTITTFQKRKVGEMLEGLKVKKNRDKIMVYGGYALAKTDREYVFLNDGEAMTIEEVQGELERVKIDDEGKLLSSKLGVEQDKYKRSLIRKKKINGANKEN